MFRGNYEHALDEKGRIAIPAKFREFLQFQGSDASLVVTALNGCAIAYPMLEWQRLEAKFMDQSQADLKTQAYIRYVVGMAHECSIDKTGRILLPQAIREVAQIDRDVTIIGQLNKIEIWSRERWLGFKQKFESQGNEALAEIIQYGLAV